MSKVTCRLSADFSSDSSTSSGMCRTRASSTTRPSCDGVSREAHQNTCPSTYVGGFQRQGQGGVGDQPGPPPRDQALLAPHAHSWGRR